MFFARALEDFSGICRGLECFVRCLEPLSEFHEGFFDFRRSSLFYKAFRKGLIGFCTDFGSYHFGSTLWWAWDGGFIVRFEVQNQTRTVWFQVPWISSRCEFHALVSSYTNGYDMSYMS